MKQLYSVEIVGTVHVYADNVTDAADKAGQRYEWVDDDVFDFAPSYGYVEVIDEDDDRFDEEEEEEEDDEGTD